jgi:hypothetical protein
MVSVKQVNGKLAQKRLVADQQKMLAVLITRQRGHQVFHLTMSASKHGSATNYATLRQ